MWGSSAPRQRAAQQEPGGPWFRLHPPPPPSPGKEESCGSPSRVAQTTGFPLDVHSTPGSVIPTAPTPDSGDTQQVLRTPWVLPVLHPVGVSLSKTALCSISFWGEHPSRPGQPRLHPPGSEVDRRPKQTHPDSLPECFPALLPRVAEPQDGAPDATHSLGPGVMWGD